MKRMNLSKALMKLCMIVIVLGMVTVPGCAILGLCACDVDHPYMDNSGNCYTSLEQCEQASSASCYICD